MKKFFEMLAGCLLVASCSEEEMIPAAVCDSTSPIATVQVVNGEIEPMSRSIIDTTKNALAFSNENAYRDFIKSLESRTYEEKTAFVGKYGVKSLYKLAEEADEELEIIGEQANSEEEFRQAYELYVEKYKGLLLKNENDPTDLTLYVPDSDNMDSYVANTDGVYVVGNEVRKANLRPKISDGISRISTLENQVEGDLKIQVNEYQYKPKDGKKVFFKIARNYDTVRVSMYCHKHMWYGWKNDPKRIMIYEPHFTGAQIAWIVPAFTRAWFSSKTPYETDILRVTGTGALTGKIYTWTDFTAEHDASGNLLYEGTGSFPCPVCLLDKSITVTVNLPKTK